MASSSISRISERDVFAARRARFAAGDTQSGANIPILTFSLIVGLVLVFGIELRCAMEIEGDGPLSTNALIAFGAAGYDRILIDGEYWRVFLAPLLHASYGHLIGNVIALFFIGIKLEPLVGRPWFAAIFVLSALGGIAASLIANPSEIVTVGASGAISGLIGALFAGSFSQQATRLDHHAMRSSALRFGIPALGPLLYGASGHTDYHAHLGGALVGAIVVLALGVIVAAGRRQPVAPAVGLSLSGGAASLAAMLCAIHAYGGMAFAPFAPMAWPAGDRGRDDSSPAYQLDAKTPAARTLVQDGRGSVTAGADAEGQATRDLARTHLAISIFKEGHRWEAWRAASDFCGGAGHAETRRLLQDAKVCD